MTQRKRPKKKVKGTRRDWKRYNGWRKHDFEFMVRNLRREVEELPRPFPVKQKGDYEGKKRGRKPADAVSVVMALALKVMLRGISYRGLYARLSADPGLRRLAGIRVLYHYNTLQTYMDKLPTGYIDELIRRTYLRGEERKKSPAAPSGGGRWTAPACGPTAGLPGSPSASASTSPAGSS